VKSTIADQELEQSLEADAWNRHDVDALMPMMTYDPRLRGGGGGQRKRRVHEGQRAVRAAYEAVFAQYPDARWLTPDTS
jgi:hypothetical protein